MRGIIFGAVCSVLIHTLSPKVYSQSGVDELIHRLAPKINLGMVVVDLTTGQTLYSRNAERLFIPASNMKLFSEAAVLMALGPDYQFKNQLSIQAKSIQNGTLQGDLHLKLSGDPSFSRQDLRQLLSSLNEWGIHNISGAVYIDSTLAATDPYPPGWLSSDLSYAYGAPVAPLILDTNRLNVTVNPATKSGQAAVIEVDDDGAGIRINNQATTAARGAKCGVGFSLDAENQLTVRGCVALGQLAVQQQMPIKNPLNYAQAIIKNELTKLGIGLNGSIQLGKTPAGSLLLATQYSRPLPQLMADTLKPSDNLYADSLYLHAAKQLNGGLVNWNQAQAVVKKFLQATTGIDFKKATFTDGSGLSRYNLVTPQQTIKLLQFLYQRFPLAYEYIAALPISGRDGTLQKRLKIPTQQGFVRAKTGYMTGVNSLSGYLYTENGHVLAFSMFINRLPSNPSGPGRPILDGICAYFLKSNKNNNTVISVASAHQRVPFQFKPTSNDYQAMHQAKWRSLEATVRAALGGQAVEVVYRGHELLIKDNQADAKKVGSALQSVFKKHPFAIAVYEKTSPAVMLNQPLMIWVQSEPSDNSIKRQWVLRESM